MRFLQLFEDFQSDVLMIFDFDDTIVDSPRFEELVIKYLREDINIKTLLDKSLKQIDKSKEDIKIDGTRLYINDPKSEIDVKGNWVRKQKKVYLVAPEEFYYDDISFPAKLTKLSSLYKKSKNKAIVTARHKNVRKLVVKYLDKLDLGQPNHGLFMYPFKDDNGSKVADWKAKTVVKLLKDTGFKKAEYFDDKPNIVDAVIKLVKSELPDVEFKGNKVESPEMTYLNEELLIEWDDRQDFINEIKDIFIDEVVDVFDIEEMPDGEEYGEGEDLPGIFYHFNDIKLALDLDRPYLEILIYHGEDHRDKFERMEYTLTKFLNRVKNLGYRCEFGQEFNDYIEYLEDGYFSDDYAFTIDVYYNLD